MTEQRFSLRIGDELIVGDTLGNHDTPHALFLHGAGQSDRQRQRLLREELAKAEVGSVALDFSGHGESSANNPGSLQKRLLQAQGVLEHIDAGHTVDTIVGTSMSGEIALRLACGGSSHSKNIRHVVLIVGAIYDRAAFELPFGADFSAAIRQPQSWRRAATPTMIGDYRGGLTIVRALDDAVIPHEIADLLFESAQSASFRRIIDLPAVDHRVSERMSHDATLRARIVAAIRQEN